MKTPSKEAARRAAMGALFDTTDELNQRLNALALGGVRGLLASMLDLERVEFFESLTSGYCVHCGREVGPGDFCQCENDE